MTILVVMLVVGAGSYALRILPMLLVDRIRMSPATERTLNDMVLAALTALVTTSVVAVERGSLAPHVPAVAAGTALALGAVLAFRGRSMGVVAAAGIAVVAAVTGVVTLVR